VGRVVWHQIEHYEGGVDDVMLYKFDDVTIDNPQLWYVMLCYVMLCFVLLLKSCYII